MNAHRERQAISAILGLAISALVATTASSVLAQTYRVGTCCSPFGDVTDGGEVQGYSVDAMDAIAEDAGFDFAWTAFPSFSLLLPAVLDHSIDIAAGPTSILSSRVEMGLAFSGVYARYTDMLIVLRTDTTPYTSVTDFAGEVIGAPDGSTYFGYLTGLQTKSHPFSDVVGVQMATGLEGRAAQREALKSGIAKAVITASFGAANWEGDPEVRIVETYEPVVLGASRIVVRQNDTALLGILQASLSKLEADGTLATLAKKWGINLP